MSEALNADGNEDECCGGHGPPAVKRPAQTLVDGLVENEHFREVCRKAGLSPDKPLYLVLATVHDAAKKAEESVRDGARGLTPEGESDIIGRVVRAVEGAMRDAVQRHRLQLERRTSVIAGAIFLASFVAGGFVGYSYGWWQGSESVERVGQEVTAAFGHGPEAAALWVQLMQNNDPRRALETCVGASVWQNNGGRACSVPLWLELPEASRQ